MAVIAWLGLAVLLLPLVMRGLAWLADALDELARKRG